MKAPQTRVRRRALLHALHNQGAPEANVRDPGALFRAQRPAMGSFFEVQVPVHVPAALALAERALDRIEALEQQMTIYRADSELAHINASAHLGPITVEPGLFALIDQAIGLSAATAGAYDVTSGALSLAWGFIRGPKRIPSPQALAEARACTGFRHVRLDRRQRTIQFDRPGIVLNLGSIGKGHALDQAAAIIRNHWWPTGAFLHGGRSSAIALGSPPGRFAGRWQVALRNPLNPDQPLGTVHLRNRALGTSGDAFQSFEVGGKTYGHILDPRTGAPAQSRFLSVTVLAPTAAEADALSTAFTLLGPEAAAQFCANNPTISALFVTETESIPGRPSLQTVNLTSADFTPNVGVRTANNELQTANREP